jgi:hypothetical protein
MVPIQAKTETALGMAMTMLAAPKNDRASPGRPVENMWCTQTPKPTTMVVTVASATAV